MGGLINALRISAVYVEAQNVFRGAGRFARVGVKVGIPDLCLYRTE